LGHEYNLFKQHVYFKWGLNLKDNGQVKNRNVINAKMKNHRMHHEREAKLIFSVMVGKSSTGTQVSGKSLRSPIKTA